MHSEVPLEEQGREKLVSNVEKPSNRTVSKGAYAFVKSLAVCLSGGVFACGVGITLLLASLPCAYYLDVRTEARARIEQGRPPDYKGDLDLLYSFFGIAEGLCIILIPALLLGALFLWLGSRKSWKTVRAMQQINYANTGHLSARTSLVRASQEPTQVQEAVLLRAATDVQDRHEEQLLRAASGKQA